MADLVTNLKTYLKTKTEVTDIVGLGTAARIYNDLGKQGASVPYIVFEVFAGSSAEHLDGISGMAMNRVLLMCYASTAAGAYALAEAVRLAPLQMFRGTMGSATVRVTSPGGYDRGIDRPTKGHNQNRYWIARDYIIHHYEDTEPAPTYDAAEYDSSFDESFA